MKIKFDDKINFEKKESFIYITDNNSLDELRYNLISKVLEKKRKGIWTEIEHDYYFFRDYEVKDINTKDVKFIKLLERVRQLNPRCSSISTFLTRLGEALVYENYIANGIQTEYRETSRYSYRKVLTEPLDWYSKITQKFFKDYGIYISFDLEDQFKHHFDTLNSFVEVLQRLEVDKEVVRNFFRNIVDYRGLDDIKYLTNEGYDLKSLLNYILNYLKPFENLEPRDAIRLLCDYWRISKEIGRNVKKYPHYLRSMHDIINSNYNAYKKEYDEKLFLQKKREDLLHETKDYCIVLPNSSKDIIKEGTDLNHCVGTYVDKIINGDLYIFFLRKKDMIDNSLVTLELKGDKITQAKGAYNRHLLEEEGKFLEKFCELKKLKMEL